MGDEIERRPEARPADEEQDTEGHSFVNPSVYSDLARERQRDLARDTDRSRSKKPETGEKKRRWPFG